jgi:hypothetical protein
MEGRATSAIVITSPRGAIMSVIADFAGYPAWASMHSAEVLGAPGPDGRAQLVRLVVDAGIFTEQLVLRYRWHGNDWVRWDLAEPGQVVTAMSGAYLLAERAGGTEVTFELSVTARFPMPAMLRRKAEQTVLDTALRGLRSRVAAIS